MQEAIYKQHNSKIRHMIRKEKERFVEDQCKNIEENATTNPTRELFKGVKSLTRKFYPIAASKMKLVRYFATEIS